MTGTPKHSRAIIRYRLAIPGVSPGVELRAYRAHADLVSGDDRESLPLPDYATDPLVWRERVAAMIRRIEDKCFNELT